MTQDLIPREVLFGNPDKISAKISRDGKYISYLAPLNGVLNIYVADLEDLDNPFPITKDEERGIRSSLWLYDNEHIIYIQDDKGDENWHIYSVNINTKESKNLTPFKGVRAGIVKYSRNFPNKLMVLLNKQNPEYFDLYQLDVASGDLELVYENKAKFSSMHIDDDYKLRFASRENSEGEVEIHQFEDDLSTTLFLTVPADDRYNTTILGFDKTGDTIYFSDSLDRNTSALISWNLKTGKKKTIYENEKVDFSGILTHPTNKTIQAVSSIYEKTEWTAFNKKVQQDIDYLKSKHNNEEISITGQTKDDNKWIIVSIADNKSPSYSIYDRKTKKEQFLFSSNSKLDQHDLVHRHPVVIPTRDGLEMVCYLTIPKNLISSSNKGNKKFIPQKPVPLILYVHGGPTARDVWGFCTTSQWLANRGYATLQVNYRGSSGFGKKYINLGHGEWAAKAHDDLLDAVNWAVDNKIAIKEKIAIMGGSYGGYAALVGLTFTPDVFACGIDIVGPSNLTTLIKSIPPYWKPYYNSLIRKIGGDPDTEEGRKFLESKSPLTFCHRINKPLLIAQGANDPRVKKAEADQIVAALKEKKIPVTYLLYPDEGHGLAKPENRMAFFAAAEQYLAKCLGGKCEPIGKDLKNSSVQIIEGTEIIEPSAV